MEFILKSSLFVGILYSFYKLFLQKETFFKSIRFYFIVGLLLTLVFPLISIPIYIDSNVVKQINVINPIDENHIENKNIVFVENNASSITKNSTTTNQIPINWLAFLKNIYILGLLFFSIKFILEISSLYQLVHKSNRLKKGNITFVETIKNIAPFSIFNYIVYNKQLFEKSELIQIIEHEKVHVTHKHSYDMLLVHLLVIVQWFNPFAWLYKKNVEQNLEFLADKFAKENHENIKEYQYLLLKTSVKNYPFALSTNFYNSLIKKRIIMLQKNPSKKLNQLKYVLLLPLIALFLYAFNTKEIEKPIKETLFPNLNFIEKTNEKVEFINPIHPKNVIKISSEYSNRTNSFTNKKQLHKGIDIVAHKGIDVYATANGIIIQAKYNKLKGNYIQIQHANNYQTNYHHLGDIQVALGEQVKVGEIISTVGNSGKTTGSHLHYEVIKENKNINPKPYINFNKHKKATTQTKKTKIYKDFNVIVSHNTTDKHIKKHIKQFKILNNIDIVFSKIKRNDNGKIIAIAIDAKNKTTNSSFSYDQNQLIPNVFIGFDKDRDEIIIEKVTLGEEISKSTKNSNNEIIEVIVNKNTTEKELKKIKKELKKVGVTITFKKVKRNKQNEIVSIKINATKKGSKVNYANSNDNGINDITIKFENDAISISDNHAHTNHFVHNGNGNLFVHADSDHKNKKHKMIIDVDEEHGNHSNIFVIDSDDKNTTYIVNGKKMTKKAFEKMNKKNIKTIEIESNSNDHSKNNYLFITKDNDDHDHGSETIKNIEIIKHHNGDNNSFFYEINSEDDDENTITTYTVNGEKMSKKEFEKFDKSKIKDLKIEKTNEIIKKNE